MQDPLFAHIKYVDVPTILEKINIKRSQRLSSFIWLDKNQCVNKLISADCRSQYFKHPIVYPRGGQTVDHDT